MSKLAFYVCGFSDESIDESEDYMVVIISYYHHLTELIFYQNLASQCQSELKFKHNQNMKASVLAAADE